MRYRSLALILALAVAPAMLALPAIPAFPGVQALPVAPLAAQSQDAPPILITEVAIPMRDGVRLAGRLYRPVELEEDVPVIVTLTPLTVEPLDTPYRQKNYQSGGDPMLETPADARTATVWLHHGPDRTSRLVLPIVTDPGPPPSS